jgi:hypothetical protein
MKAGAGRDRCGCGEELEARRGVYIYRCGKGKGEIAKQEMRWWRGN